MPQDLNLDRPIQLRNGLKAEVVARYTEHGTEKFTALITIAPGNQFTRCYKLDGKYNGHEKNGESPQDIVNVPAVKKSGWVNLILTHGKLMVDGWVYATHDAAQVEQAHYPGRYFITAKVEWEEDPV